MPRLLGREGSQRILGEITSKLLPRSEAQKLKKAAGFRKPYLDPAMKDPRRYADMVRRLWEAGVVDLVGDHRLATERVGMFCVKKKSGRQRLVIDARAANFWFEHHHFARAL